MRLIFKKHRVLKAEVREESVVALLCREHL